MFYKFSFNRMRNVVLSGNESNGMSAVCVFKSTIHVIYIVFDAPILDQYRASFQNSQYDFNIIYIIIFFNRFLFSDFNRKTWADVFIIKMY